MVKPISSTEGFWGGCSLQRSLQFDSIKKLNRRKFLQSSGGAFAATISFSGSGLAKEVGGEVYVTSAVSSPRRYDIYQAPIGYVTQPKLDKCGEHFVSGEVRESGFGISPIFLPCRAVRDYFYRLPGAVGDAVQTSYNEDLRIPASATPAELRVAYRLRTLELGTDRRDQQEA